MIEKLDGIREFVNYKGEFKFLIYFNREYEDYQLHWHTDTEIIMPIEKNYQVNINEVQYNLKPNDIIIIPPGELHRLFAPPSGYRIIIQFDTTLLYNLWGFDAVFRMLRPCITVTPSSIPNIHKDLSSLISEIALEYSSESELKEASIYSMIIRFFTILARNSTKDNSGFTEVKKLKQHKYIDLILKICNYINEHCTDSICVDDIAKIAGFSKYHFARIFKQVMNVSCYEYLVNRRLIYAEELLLEPDLSIMQVAMKSGFSSLATFNRVFKAKNGCTPKEYRLKCKI